MIALASLALAAAGGGAALLALLAVLPWRGRAVVRAGLLWLAVLSPIGGLAAWLAVRERIEPAGWLMLLPAALVYLAAIDLALGVSARLGRRSGPARTPRANGQPDAGSPGGTPER